MSIYVIGHKNPDTDSICSAVGYAHLLQLGGTQDAVAACCGDITARNQFVLTEAGVPFPEMLRDARPTAGHICSREPICANSGETFFDVYRRMQEHSLSDISVVDDEQRLIGIVALADLLQLLLPGMHGLGSSRQVDTNLKQIRDVVNGRLLHGVEIGRREKLILVVGAMSVESLSTRLQQYDPESLILLCGDRDKIQRLAIEYGVRCLVITGNHDLSAELLELAKQRGVSIISVPHDTAMSAFMIKSARRIDSAVQTQFLSFAETTPLGTVARAVKDSPQSLFPVVDEQNRLLGTFSRSALINPTRTKLILVDHNEFSQAVHGAEEADILEVVDHHRLGGNLTTRLPIRFINEPVGATCTIVARQYRDRGLTPPPPIALCLSAGIISDTLNLSSPTTTETDREILNWLGGCAERNLERFASAFFAAGSALQSYTAAEALKQDCKQYQENGWKIAVSQVEESGLEIFWEKKEELSTALADLAHEQNCDFACLMVTDITRHYSLLLTHGEPEIRHSLNYPKLETNLYELRGIVSRKKELLPHLMLILNKVDKEEQRSGTSTG
jgi:manganese-dependent inorganic pyrophosphatase